MNFSLYHFLLSVLCAFLTACLFAGCGGNEASDDVSHTIYFPEIGNMSLIVLDSAIREGVELDKSIFFMDRYEVTNRDFAAFMEATNYAPSLPDVFLEHWKDASGNRKPPTDDMLDYPVVFVNYADACAYARHYGKALPSKEQWLWGAIGWVGNKRYPWGDQFMNFYCNSWRSGIHGLSKVGTFEYGKSEWGCYDMVGNASEWCATRAEDRIEETYYVLGGSWSHGGTPQEEEKAFNLLEQNETAEAGSRNNQLGFRCVKIDALRFIRETLVPRIAALGWEDRLQAVGELSEMIDPLYSVMKLLQFEATISRPLSTQPSLSLICSQEIPGLDGNAFLLCHDDGVIRSLSIDGEEIWRVKQSEEDAPYRFKTASNHLGPDDKVIVYSWLNSLLAVFDAARGTERWRTGSGGLAQHVQVVRTPGSNGGLDSRLLVVWHTDDRYEVMDRLLKPFLDEIYDRIRIYASVFLTQEALASPRRDDRLSFFVKDADTKGVDNESRFNVNRFDDLVLHMDGALDRRYWIQLLNGAYFSTDVQTSPECRLTLYDLDSGRAQWTRDFPGSLLEFKGVITREPLVFDDGKRVALVLQEESGATDLESSSETMNGGDEARPDEICLCVVNLETGDIEFQYRMADSTNHLTGLTAVGTKDIALAAIAGARDLLLIRKASEETRFRGKKGEDGGAWRVQRRMLSTVLAGVRESIMIDESGVPVQVSRTAEAKSRSDLTEGASPAETDFPDSDPPGLHDFWSPCASLSPWLVTEPDADNHRLLLTHQDGGVFNKAFIVGGAFNRSVCLSDEAEGRLVSYMLVWDSSGNMLCFDARASRYLWKLELGAITDLMKPVMTDLNRDGLFEAAIPLLSGEIRIVELDSGKSVLNMMRVGASYTFLIPVEVDDDPSQELLVGIRDRGVFLMNNSPEAEDKSSVDLRLATLALEQWKTLRRGH